MRDFLFNEEVITSVMNQKMQWLNLDDIRFDNGEELVIVTRRLLVSIQMTNTPAILSSSPDAGLCVNVR